MMIRNKVALAALMMAFTLSPASAAKKPQKNGKATTSSSKKKSVGKKAAVVGATATAAAAAAIAGENSRDRTMNYLSGQFLTNLWRLNPESAISAGKYDGAANLTIPDAANRQRQLAFIDEWLEKFGANFGKIVEIRS